jgi:hypothetical protein
MATHREFLGILVTGANYREIKEQKPTKEFSYTGADALKFHQKHLKSYLAGYKTFTHGFTYSERGFKIPTVHNVQFKLEEV